MARQSAGILIYRLQNPEIEVLLVHPGGPFWAKKNAQAWSVPKGEPAEGEGLLVAAKREFREEIGQQPPDGQYIDLGSCKRAGKQIYVWAIEGDLEVSKIISNTITIEWPPRSGEHLEIPEVDRAEWVRASDALVKLHMGQDVFVRRLADVLGVVLREASQQSLL